MTQIILERKMTMINWDKLQKTDMEVIDRICIRALKTYPNINKMTLHMDLTAAHVSGECPLDLLKLEAFDDLDFWHDIVGIWGNLDRKTGELMNCFIPRCAA